MHGVLHGLYVFWVIRDFHRAMLRDERTTPAKRSYLARRIESIDKEMLEVRDVARSPDLTEVGRKLGARLTEA